MFSNGSWQCATGSELCSWSIRSEEDRSILYLTGCLKSKKQKTFDKFTTLDSECGNFSIWESLYAPTVGLILIFSKVCAPQRWSSLAHFIAFKLRVMMPDPSTSKSLNKSAMPRKAVLRMLEAHKPFAYFVAAACFRRQNTVRWCSVQKMRRDQTILFEFHHPWKFVTCSATLCNRTHQLYKNWSK